MQVAKKASKRDSGRSDSASASNSVSADARCSTSVGRCRAKPNASGKASRGEAEGDLRKWRGAQRGRRSAPGDREELRMLRETFAARRTQRPARARVVVDEEEEGEVEGEGEGAGELCDAEGGRSTDD